MASYHFTIKNSSQTQASANMRADYICREGKYSKGEKAEDLIYKEHGNMPYWALANPRKFWEASEIYEKAGKRTSFREIEFALPNELARWQQIKLVKEFVDKHFGKDFVYSYAIHEKAASLAAGVQNPHVHILFCERKLDGIDRDELTFFKRADTEVPARGGAAKDRERWNGKGRRGYLRYMREDCADLQNTYLERDGFAERVDHRTKYMQFMDAMRAGDLDKAEMLDCPPEKHLGPKASQKVKRDLRMLAAAVADPNERKKLRSQYWESRRETLEVYQLRTVRAFKQELTAVHAVDERRGPVREARSDEIAVNAFWRLTDKKIKSMHSELALEKYRLEKAQSSKKQNQHKIEAWKKHYQERVQELKALEEKFKNRKLVPEDVHVIKQMGTNIRAVEQEKREAKTKLSKDVILNEMFPGLSPADIVAMAMQKIAHLDAEISILRKEQKDISKKIRTPVQVRLIAEWSASKGFLPSIRRDEKYLLEEKRKIKIAIEKFELLPIPSSADQAAKHDYKKERVRLKMWQRGIRDFSRELAGKRSAWQIEKERPAVKAQIDKMEQKFKARNDGIQEKVAIVQGKMDALYDERSDWRRIKYALTRPLELGQFLRFSRAVHMQLHKAVQKLREERPRGRMSGLRVHVEDEVAPKRLDRSELER